MLTQEQTQEIKKQIIQQIEKTFPDDKKEFAKQQIISMNSEQLEQFLRQNKLIKEQQTSGDPKTQENIFRSIVNREISSYKIDENKNCIAVLEINPISKGHIIIIPKEPVLSADKLPKQAFSLAKKISKKIKSKLKPKEVLISSANVLGENIINILPVYEHETFSSERYKAEEKELLEIQKKLEKKIRKKIFKKKKETTKILRLPKRIP